MALQLAIPNARVLYCSATGASEPKNLGYMTRLGHFGWSNTVDMVENSRVRVGRVEYSVRTERLEAISVERSRTKRLNSNSWIAKFPEDVRLMYDRSTAFWLMLSECSPPSKHYADTALKETGKREKRKKSGVSIVYSGRRISDSLDKC